MKIKANVGCSNSVDNPEIEREKILYSLAMGVDYVSEISLIPHLKRELLEFIKTQSHQSTKFCSVPLYDSLIGDDSLLDVMRLHHSYGVKCFTLHLTPLRLTRAAADQGFVINSRAGNFLYGLAQTGRENPHLAVFQELMAFIRQTNCELFVGTSLRPGRIVESRSSRLWLEELNFVRAFMKEQGVHQDEYILECGGHIDSSLIETFAESVVQNKICVMGPLLTDATHGFDDLSSVIGTSVLNAYKEIHTHLILTRDEHIRLPTIAAFKSAVDSALILKHNVNLLRKDATTTDLESRFHNQSSRCTVGLNLFGPINPGEAACTMCGKYCPLENIKFRQQ